MAIAKRRERRSDAEPTFAPRNAVGADSRRSLDEGRLRKNETLAENGRRGRESAMKSEPSSPFSGKNQALHEIEGHQLLIVSSNRLIRTELELNKRGA